METKRKGSRNLYNNGTQNGTGKSGKSVNCGNGKGYRRRAFERPEAEQQRSESKY
jgi:hypothetical protein